MPNVRSADLFNSLKRRKITIKEWLQLNSVNSMEDFQRIIDDTSFEVSSEMKEKVLDLLNKQQEEIQKNKTDEILDLPKEIKVLELKTSPKEIEKSIEQQGKETDENK